MSAVSYLISVGDTSSGDNVQAPQDDMNGNYKRPRTVTGICMDSSADFVQLSVLINAPTLRERDADISSCQF